VAITDQFTMNGASPRRGLAVFVAVQSIWSICNNADGFPTWAWALNFSLFLYIIFFRVIMPIMVAELERDYVDPHYSLTSELFDSYIKRYGDTEPSTWAKFKLLLHTYFVKMDVTEVTGAQILGRYYWLKRYGKTWHALSTNFVETPPDAA